MEQSELYLTHLSMKGDGSDAQVPQHQRHPLGVVARAAKNHEGVPGQLVQNGHQVTVLQHDTQFKHTTRKKKEKSFQIGSNHSLPYTWMG